MKRTILLLLTLFFPLLTLAQNPATVTGHTIFPSSGAAQNSSVCFTLQNFKPNIPRVLSTGTVVEQQNWCIIPSTVDGSFSTPVLRNDFLSPAGTFWRVDFLWNGVQQSSANFLINHTPFNLDTEPPLNTTPIVGPNQIITQAFVCPQPNPVTTWTCTHNFNDTNIDVSAYDTSGNRIFPNTLVTTSPNVVTLTWVVAQAGTAVILHAGSVAIATNQPNAVLQNPTGNQVINGGFSLSVGAPTTFSGTTTAANLNKVVYVDQQVGATADAKVTTACALIPSGGILDMRGFGTGAQVTAAAISCGSSSQTIKFLFDPSTKFQPGSATQTVFQLSQNNDVEGLSIDTTNQATYSGSAFVNAAQGITTARFSRIKVTMATGTTGKCLDFNATSASIFLTFKNAFDINCTIAGGGVAPAATAFNFRNSGGGFINGTQWYGLQQTGFGLGINIAQTGTGAITSNGFYGYECEMLSASNLSSCLKITATGVSGNSASMNKFYMNCWDLTGSVNCVNVASTTGVNRNIFSGQLVVSLDSSSFISNIYEDLFSGTLNGATINPLSLSDMSVRDQLETQSIIVGCSLPNCATVINGVSGTGSSFVSNTGPTINSPTLSSPVINGSSTGTGVQGTDSKLLTSGTISGTAVNLCTDANGGATTSGCIAPVIQVAVNSSVCTTAAAAGSSCTTTVNWPSSFADVNYRVSCGGIGPTQFPFYTGITSKLVGSVTVQITNGTSNEAQASTFNSIECIGIHP